MRFLEQCLDTSDFMRIYQVQPFGSQIRALTFVLMLVFVVVGFSATSHSEVEAASKKMKLSATSKKLDIGKSFTLKIYTQCHLVSDKVGNVHGNKALVTFL